MPETFPYGPADVVDHVTDVNAEVFNPVQKWLEYGTDVIPRFKVDPNNAKAYATVNLAYAAADSGLPTNMPIILELASNKTHTMSSTLALVTSRDLIINGAGRDNTELIGAFTLSDATAEPARRVLHVNGVTLTLNANFTTAGNWHFVAEDVLLDDNGGYEVVWVHDTDDCNVSFIRCRMAPLSDANSSWSWYHGSSAATAGLFEIVDSYLTIYMSDSSNWMNPRGAGKINVINSTIDIDHNGGGAYPGSLINFRSSTWALEFQNSELRMRTLPSAGSFDIVTQNANATVAWNGLKVFLSTTDSRVVNFNGNTGTHTGAPVVHESNDDFTNPPDGTQWFNSVLGKWATYREGTTYAYWQWSDWAPGECVVSVDNGDLTASTGSFNSITNAYNALNDVLGANDDMSFNLKAGTTHDFAGLSIGGGHNIFIRTPMTVADEQGQLGKPKITGTVTLASADSAPSRREFVIDSVHTSITVNSNSYWHVSVANTYVDQLTCNRTHGTKGSMVAVKDVVVNNGEFTIIDADAAPSAWSGEVRVANSRIQVTCSVSGAWDFVNAVYVLIINSAVKVNGDGAGECWIDFAGAATFLNFDNSNIRVGGTTPIIFKNSASVDYGILNSTIEAKYNATTVDVGILGGADFGGSTFNIQGFTTAPTNVNNGTVWTPVGGRVATYREGTTYDYWQWSDWAPGECLVDTAAGDLTASTGSFDTLTNAYNALNDVTAANAGLMFKLVPGQTYATGAPTTFANTRSISLISTVPMPMNSSGIDVPAVSGNIVLADNEGGTVRAFLMGGIKYSSGDITQNSDWNFHLEDVSWYTSGTITRTHGTGNCIIYGRNVYANSGGMLITDTDACANYTGQVEFYNSRLQVPCDAGGGWDFVGGVSVVLHDCLITAYNDGSTVFIDWNGATGGIDFRNTTLRVTSNSMTLFSNAGSIGGRIGETRVTMGSSQTGVTIGALGSIYDSGHFRVIGAVPTTVPDGTIWENPSTGRSATYREGTALDYWQWSDWAPGTGRVDTGGDVLAATGFFDTINSAYAALHDVHTAGEIVIIDLATYQSHTLSGDLTVDTSRSVLIQSQNTDKSNGGTIGSTRVTGNFICPSSVAGKMFSLKNVRLSGNITTTAYWHQVHSNVVFANTVFTVAGTNNFDCYFTDCYFREATVVQTDTFNGSMYFERCKVDASNITFLDCTRTDTMKFRNCEVALSRTSATTVFYNPQAYASASLILENVSFSILGSSGGVPEILTNHASSNVAWRDVRIVGAASSMGVDLGADLGTHAGAPTVKLDTVPANAPDGTIWNDLALNDILVWDGTYWGNNGIYRHDVDVNIGSAAASHDVGWDVPSGGAVISMSVKLLKALTGAGGATAAGLGTSGDPDKYAETLALTIDTADQNLHGTFNDGGGDDLKISATDGAGNPSGTLAGSDAADVRALVYFGLPKSL